MKKAELLQDIQTKLEIMYFELIESGVNDSMIKRYINIQDRPIEIITNVHKWVQEIFNNEYHSVTDVRACVPENVWVHYKLLEYDNLIEIQMLKKAHSALRTKLNKGIKIGRAKRKKGKSCGK